MAGTKVRGITIELSADASGISSALKDVNKQISSTGRELKDIDRLLKLDPTNVQLLAQKQETLQRQMEQTREKVKLLKEAEEDLKKQMVDSGTEEQQKQLAALERELISSEQKINKYAQEMDQAGKETDQFSKSQKEAENATESLSGGFSVLKGALANLAADGIRMATNALKDLIAEGPQYADEILSMASKTSIATDTLQELSYMSDLVDVDVNTVAGSMKKLTKSMDSARSGSGSAAEAFKTLGVSVTDSNGQLRSSEDVFFDAIEALGGIQNEAERDAVAMKIFDKSATELNPMIEAGDDALRGFAEEAHEMGYVLDQDALEKLERVQDAFDRFNRKMTAVKNTVAAGVAPAIERAMQKLQSIVDRINWEKFGEQLGKAFEGIIDAFEWIIDNGDTISAVLAGIIAAFAAAKIIQVVQGIQKMTQALLTMNAAANANPYVLLISAIVGVTVATVSLLKSAQAAYVANNDLIQSMDDSLSVLDENTEKINEMSDAYDEARQAREDNMNAGLEEMAHIETLSSELSTLADANGVVQESDQARAQFILGELNQALGTEYTMTGNQIQQYTDLAGAIDTVIEKKRAEIMLQSEEEAYRQAVVGRGDAERTLEKAINDRASAEAALAQISQQLDDAQQGVNDSFLGTSQGAYGLGNDLSILYEKYNEAQAKLEEYDAAIQTSAEVVDKYAYDITQYEENATKAISGNYDQITYKSWETAKAQGEASQAASAAVISSTTAAQQQWLEDLGAMVTAATGKQVEFKDAGKGMVQAVVDGQDAGKEVPVNNVQEMAKQMVTEIQKVDPEYVASGQNIPAGIAQGINSGSGQAYTAVTTLAQTILSKFNAEMKIKSPSRKMEWSAIQTIAGFDKGIKKNGYKAADQMQSLARDITTAFNQTLLAKTADATDEYQRSIDKIIDKNKKLYEDVSKLSTNLKKDIDGVTDKLKKNIESVRGTLSKEIEKARAEYEKAVQSRYDATMNQLGLMDIFDAEKEGLTTDELKANLKTQITALEEWSATMNDLRRRIKNKELLKELEGIGVEDKETLNAIDSMTNKELADFEKLYAKKQKIAKNEALQANKVAKTEMESKISELRKQADEDIKKLKADAEKQITQLQNQYIKDLKKLGINVTKTSVSVGKSIAQGILTGFESTIKSAKGDTAKALSGLLANIKKQLKINSPSGLTKPFGKYLAQGISVGFTDEMKAVNRNIRMVLPNSSLFAGATTMGQASVTTNNNYTQNIYSPKAPSRLEIYRDSRNLLNYVKR